MTRPLPRPRMLRGPAGRRIAVAAALTGALTSGLAAPLAAAPGVAAAAGRAVAAAPDAAEDDAPPLTVTIETLSPSTAPQRGRVTVTGTVTNRSESTWTDLNVYLFASAEPMTDPAELAEANASDERTEVGARITTPGLYDEVPDLPPGATTSYQLSVPVNQLPFDEPGVYWLGVHVLGSDDAGRVQGADGRARTFMSAMPDREPRATLSLVLPIRERVARDPEGRLANVAPWAERLDQDGRLERLVDLAATAEEVPLSWVVDPAVLDAVVSLSEGLPGFDMGPTDTDPAEPAPSPSAGESGSTVGPLDPDADDDPRDELGELSEEARTAEAWLAEFMGVAAGADVLTLPYGDIDVASVLRRGHARTLDTAQRLSARTVAQLGLDADPVLAPANGILPTTALERLDPESQVLLSERAVDSDATVLRLPQGSRAVVTSDVARIGGPTPTPRYDALALRQRILAEAAVHGLTAGSDAPLVVTAPDRWDPGAGWRAASFFDGLDVPWLRTVDISTVSALTQPEDYDGRLSYSPEARRAEVPTANVVQTQRLVGSGTVLSGLLSRNDTIDEQVARAAMLGSSVHARRRPRHALALTRRISREIEGALSSVFVEGSSLVTMSSETGNFSVTVINDLEEPVTVGIRATSATPGLDIEAREQVSLGPRQRASVRLSVTATGTGVHSVRIVPTTQDGQPLGRTTTIMVRSSQVGLVIWLVMGTGAAILVVALVTRVVRRVRARKRTHGPMLQGSNP